MDRGVIATAAELFEGRHYPGVVAMCTDALEDEPECVPLLLIRARAHIALRRDLDAQADLRDVIRLDPLCALAFRLLGELAARRDENESAAIFFREALRLDPGDREAADWLQIVGASIRPAAVAKKLPAPAAAAGRFSVGREPDARRARPEQQPRFARGTNTPEPGVHDERPTKPFARGSERQGASWAATTMAAPPQLRRSRCRRHRCRRRRRRTTPGRFISRRCRRGTTPGRSMSRRCRRARRPRTSR